MESWEPDYGIRVNIDFDRILNEKLCVISQFDQQSDELGISEIANEFMNEISEIPKDNNKIYKSLLNHPVVLIYRPIENPTYIGYAQDGNCIVIQKFVNDDNYLEIKYTLIHELIHIVQQIRTSVLSKYDTVGEKVKRKLMEVTIEDINPGTISDPFIYLMYRENIYEIYAWSHNGYEKAFSYKLKHPEKSDSDVMKHVLKRTQMDSDFLNMSIQRMKSDQQVFTMMIGILIGQFSEFTPQIGQRYFDRDVFLLPVVKKMKRAVMEVLNVYNNVDDIMTFIDFIIRENFNDLLKNKQMIIDSFVKHVKFWFDKAKVKMGKAITLGIEDATRKSEEV